MELKDKLKGRQVYIDTNIIIYLVEGFSSYQRLVNDIQELLEIEELIAFTSELSLCEILIKPFKMNATAGVSLFRTFLEESNCLVLLPIDKEILVQSAYISAATGLKTPDAIHVATAIASDCEVFFTNDNNIRTPKRLEKVLFSDYL